MTVYFFAQFQNIYYRNKFNVKYEIVIVEKHFVNNREKKTPQILVRF